MEEKVFATPDVWRWRPFYNNTTVKREGIKGEKGVYCRNSTTLKSSNFVADNPECTQTLRKQYGLLQHLS